MGGAKTDRQAGSGFLPGLLLTGYDLLLPTAMPKTLDKDSPRKEGFTLALGLGVDPALHVGKAWRQEDGAADRVDSEELGYKENWCPACLFFFFTFYFFLGPQPTHSGRVFLLGTKPPRDRHTLAF